MSGTLVLIELAGHVGLLLWGTRMVTTGVQRGFGSALRLWLERNLGQRWRAFLAGVGTTAILQSSTATSLMATAFTVNGIIGLAPALAVMLGANVGTTLVTQLLSFDITAVGPLAIIGGVILFQSSEDDRLRNSGRIAIGLGLMLTALSGMVHGLAPLETAPVLKSVFEALADQPVLAMLISAFLTWLCHSSVAVILLVVSLATAHVVSPTSSLALVLGANLGGTLAPLLEAGSPIARRLPIGNAAVRALGCAVVLPFLPLVASWIAHIDPAPERMVVNFHTAFNLVLAALFILPTEQIARLLVRLLPDPPRVADPGTPLYLEPSALEAASVALANAARETLRMADLVEVMLKRSLDVFRTGDPQAAPSITSMDGAVDRLGGAIRRYLADLGNAQPLDDEHDGARAQEILSAVINLEHVGDIVANSLLDFGVKRIRRGRPYSNEEIDVIASMHAEILESLRLGVAVFLTCNAEDAMRLVSRKVPLRALEARAAAVHVQLLRRAVATGSQADTGDRIAAVADEGGQFLRVVRDLRRVHSHIATLAYPVLESEHRVSPHTRPLEQNEPKGPEDEPPTEQMRRVAFALPEGANSRHDL